MIHSVHTQQFDLSIKHICVIFTTVYHKSMCSPHREIRLQSIFVFNDGHYVRLGNYSAMHS